MQLSKASTYSELTFQNQNVLQTMKKKNSGSLIYSPNQVDLGNTMNDFSYMIVNLFETMKTNNIK